MYILEILEDIHILHSEHETRLKIIEEEFEWSVVGVEYHWGHDVFEQTITTVIVWCILLVFPEAIVLESCSVSILFHIIRVLRVMIPN
jgi:hypothetical protein